MLKIIPFICILFLLFSCSKKNEMQERIIVSDNYDVDQEDHNLDRKMYVYAPSGLRVRNLPSTDGEIVGVLEDGAKVNVIREDENFIEINNAYGRWVYINSPVEGWVFSGFLSDYYSKIFFASNKDDLNIYSEADINSRVKGTLGYGEIVGSLHRSDIPVTIDGKTSYWYYISASSRDIRNGWVFGGNLADRPPANPIIGSWNIESRPEIFITFHHNNFFIGWHYENSGHATYYGTWEITGDNIVIILETLPPPGWDPPDGRKWIPEYTEYKMRFNIINIDSIDVEGTFFGNTRFFRRFL